MESLIYITKRGNEISEVFHNLAHLRIVVFRDFPYLYAGSIEYEKEYLSIYSQSDRSFLFAVYSEGKMVGATTCIPLQDESAEIRTPFEQEGYKPENLFYFGESILLPQYRGKGLGHRFFDEREDHARSFGQYQKACFLSVEREENHPARPQGYRSNDIFWEKRGYRKKAHIRASIEWTDINEAHPTPKTLVGWMKKL